MIINDFQYIVIQDNQDNHDNHNYHDNHVRLAHLWVDFRVILYKQNQGDIRCFFYFFGFLDSSFFVLRTNQDRFVS